MYHNPNSGKTCRVLMQSTTEHILVLSDSNFVARHTRVCQSRVWPMSVMSVHNKSVQQHPPWIQAVHQERTEPEDSTNSCTRIEGDRRVTAVHRCTTEVCSDALPESKQWWWEKREESNDDGHMMGKVQQYPPWMQAVSGGMAHSSNTWACLRCQQEAKMTSQGREWLKIHGEGDSKSRRDGR
jgi:hypothetical protein